MKLPLRILMGLYALFWLVLVLSAPSPGSPRLAAGRLTVPPGDPPAQPVVRTVRIPLVVRAYCPCSRCCSRETWRTASGYRIKKTDYIIAVSPDLEKYLPVSTRTKINVPGYNKPTNMSMACDRTRRDRYRQVEVLMTLWKRGKSPHKRALLWGHKGMVLTVTSHNRRIIRTKLSLRGDELVSTRWMKLTDARRGWQVGHVNYPANYQLPRAEYSVWVRPHGWPPEQVTPDLSEIVLVALEGSIQGLTVGKTADASESTRCYSGKDARMRLRGYRETKILATRVESPAEPSSDGGSTPPISKSNPPHWRPR